MRWEPQWDALISFTITMSLVRKKNPDFKYILQLRFLSTTNGYTTASILSHTLRRLWLWMNLEPSAGRPFYFPMVRPWAMPSFVQGQPPFHPVSLLQSSLHSNCSVDYYSCLLLHALPLAADSKIQFVVSLSATMHLFQANRKSPDRTYYMSFATLMSIEISRSDELPKSLDILVSLYMLSAQSVGVSLALASNSDLWFPGCTLGFECSHITEACLLRTGGDGLA